MGKTKGEIVGKEKKNYVNNLSTSCKKKKTIWHQMPIDLATLTLNKLMGVFVISKIWDWGKYLQVFKISREYFAIHLKKICSECIENLNVYFKNQTSGTSPN